MINNSCYSTVRLFPSIEVIILFSNLFSIQLWGGIVAGADGDLRLYYRAGESGNGPDLRHG